MKAALALGLALTACKSSAAPKGPDPEPDLCAALATALEAGDDYFERSKGDLRGPGLDKGEHLHRTSLRLPGTMECEIIDVTWSETFAVLHCWQAAVDHATYKDFVDRTGKCLDGWIAEHYRDGPRVSFTRDDAGEVEVTVSLDLLGDGSMQVYVRATEKSDVVAENTNGPEGVFPSRPSVRQRFH